MWHETGLDYYSKQNGSDLSFYIDISLVVVDLDITRNSTKRRINNKNLDLVCSINGKLYGFNEATAY